MNALRLPSLLLAAALALGPLCAAHAEGSTSTVAFSDPSKPGTLKVRIFHGDLKIEGADVKDVTVRSDSSSALNPTPRKDGMRVLSTSSGYQLTEKDNVAFLDYSRDDGWSGGSSDFEITVPKNTNLIISNTTSGECTCSNLAGDIDVRRMGGDVKLEEISGGALVETMNGDVTVRVKALAPGRPLSFTSMHGEIRLRVPGDAKANIRFRTHKGVILTNFDDKSLVTKTEIAHPMHLHMDMKIGDGNAPAAPAAPAAPVAPDAPAAAPAPAALAGPTVTVSDDSDDWRSDVRDSVREAARDAAEAARDAAEAVREGLAEAHIDMHGGMMPPLPPMTGGKVVSGVLNGGGVSIEAATLNGDITLKKVE